MQVVYHVVDSLGVSQPETIEKASEPITNLFVEGGLAGMIAITVLLICLFFAAWKAPKWVKEIGLGALVVGIFWSLRGLSQMLGVLQMIGDVSPAVICGGYSSCPAVKKKESSRVQRLSQKKCPGTLGRFGTGLCSIGLPWIC